MPLIVPAPNKLLTPPPAGSLLNTGIGITQGLIGYWPMLEGGGSVLHDYTGQITGQGVGLLSGPTWAPPTAGAPGPNLAFTSGSTNQVNFNSSPTLMPVNAVSVVAWVYRTGNWGGQGIFAAPENFGNQPGYQLYGDFSTGTKARAQVFSSGPTSHLVDSTPVITLNTWMLAAMTYDSATLKVYVNANKPDTLAVNLAMVYTNPTQDPARIGDYSGSAGPAAHIGPVAVWNRALSPGEIAQLYYQPWCMLVPANPMQRWWFLFTPSAAAFIATPPLVVSQAVKRASLY